MVYLIVDDEKTIMGFGEDAHWNGRVLGVVPGNVKLGVVPGNVKLELASNPQCMDGCFYPGAPFIQHSQYGVIHIVVD